MNDPLIQYNYITPLQNLWFKMPEQPYFWVVCVLDVFNRLRFKLTTKWKSCETESQHECEWINTILKSVGSGYGKKVK